MKKLLNKIMAYCLCITIFLSNGNFVYAGENIMQQVKVRENIVTSEDVTQPEEVTSGEGISPEEGTPPEEITSGEGTSPEEITPGEGTSSEEITPEEGTPPEEITPGEGTPPEDITPEEGTSTEKIKVLMIGNSFTKMGEYSLATILKEIGKANDKNLDVTTITNGGAYLSYYAFWTPEYKGYFDKVLSTLKGKQYNYIILQEQTKAAIENYENEMLPAVKQLYTFINAYQDDAKVFIYETAPYENNTSTNVEGEKFKLLLKEFQELALYGYGRLQKETGIERIPAGMQTYYSIQVYPEINMVSSDLRHPNYAGYYMAAASVYYKIYNEKPETKVDDLTKCDIDNDKLSKLNGLVGEEIKLNKNQLTLNTKSSAYLTAQVIADSSRKGTVSFKSLNPTVATVDANTGMITGIAEGTTAVLAQTSTGLMKECIVTVKNNEPSQLSFGQSYYIVSAGDIIRILPQMKNWQSDEVLTWTSSNQDVASVSANGTVTTKKMGKTVIKVKSSKDKTVTASYSLYVVGKSPENLTATLKTISSSGGTVELKWDPVYGAKKYQIYRYDTVTGNTKVIGSAESNFYTDNTIGVNTRYSYKVTAMALSALSESAMSNEVSVMLLGTVENDIAVMENHIKLTWTKNESATGYEIYRSEKKNSGYRKIKVITTNTTLSYKDSTVEKGKTYYYKIKAYKTEEPQKLYSVDSNIVKGSVLEPIIMKNLTITENSLKLSWNKNENATGYEIYRSEKKDGTYEQIAVIKENKTIIYNDSAIEKGKDYYYKIRAYKKGSAQTIYSSYSEIVTGAVLESIVINNPTVTSKLLKLTWSKNAKATGYEIYRSEKKNSGYSKIKVITDNKKVSYKDSSIEKGKIYYYKIRAYKKDSEQSIYSEYSEIVKGFVLQPTIIKKVVVESKSLKLIWNRNAKATGYEIYRSQKKNSGYKKIATITQNKRTYYYDHMIKKGETYYYKIRAYQRVGQKKVYGEYSNNITGKVPKTD